MDFQITLVGLNHRTASVDVRERFALASHCASANWIFARSDSLRESFILSTCNRVEVAGIGPQDTENALVSAWAAACASAPADLVPYTYSHHDLEAVRHLFTVASSLDSMVLGEPQILGQMKAAYRKAVESGAAGPILNRIMHKAFSTAKRVRHETAVAANAVSISYAAVELAKRIFGQMENHRALLLGAGEMAELAATHLLQAGMAEILVANRTFARGEELARRFRGRAIPFENFSASLSDVDIVIASTGSPDPIITPAHVQGALKARKNRPMFFIDIAVPRDIDPLVNEIDNIYLYDIDDLREVVEENMQTRQEEAIRARAIIDDETANFGEWLENLAAKPTILELIRRGDAAAAMEVNRTLRRIGPVSQETREALETMAHALVHKLNHEPIMFLKNAGMSRQPPHARISLVRRIFNLDGKENL